MSNTQQLLDFIKQGHTVSYNLVMEFVRDCLTIREVTAECILRHNRDKVNIIHKDQKDPNSPVIAYEWRLSTVDKFSQNATIKEDVDNSKKATLF